MNWNDKRVIVFGGGGFLGRYIVESLLEKGCASVRSFGRSDQPELRGMGVDVVQGDLRDSDAVTKACADIDVVFLTAAKAGVWGSWESYYGINVLGAENVVNACRSNGISTMVYTSSPSVAYSAEDDIENMNEDNPYPDHYLAHYPKSKSIAEQAVLAETDDTFKTVSLRPHLIWGPRDPHLIPRVLDAARAGRLKVVGNGKNKVDMTHVVNGADAHIKAAEALCDPERCDDVAGKAYFISDDNPVELWSWTNSLLERCGIPRISGSISYKAAFRIGRVMEWVFTALPFLGEPPMSRFIAGQFAHSHWFDISAAKRDFGYTIIVDPDCALDKFIDSVTSS